MILARAVVRNDVPENNFAREAADYDALHNLSGLSGLVQGRVSFAVAGVLELGSNFYTTGCDVEVIEADERDP